MNSTLLKRSFALAAVVLAACTWYLSGQTPTPPARFPGPTSSQPLALSADDSLLLVANPDNNSVSLFDARTGNTTLITQVTVGKEPNGVALSPDGSRAYVANTAGGTVSVFSIDRAQPLYGVATVATITVGAEPYGVALTPTGRKLYVANARSNSVSVIDTTTNQVVRTIANVGPEPRGVAITNSGSGADTVETVLVTQFLALPVAGKTDGADDAKVGHVTVISASTDAVVADVTLNALADSGFKAAGDALARTAPPAAPVAVDFRFTTGAYPNQLSNIAIRGNFAFVPNTGASPNGPVRFDVNTQSLLSVLDLRSRADAGRTINMHQAVAQQTATPKRFITQPWAIAFKNRADQGYVVSAASNIVVKVAIAAATGAATVQTDPADANRVLQIPTGKNPRGIVVNAADTRAYVMNYVSRDVTVIDLTGAAERVVATVSSANLPAPGSADDTIQIGKELYFTSVGEFDPPASGQPAITGRMSNNGWGSCGSCHPFGLTDNVVWIFAAGPRRTVPQHVDFAGGDPASLRALNWSGIFDEEEDFELNIRGVSGGLGLIVGADGITPEPTVAAFTPPNASRRQLRVRGVDAWDAIKAFVRSGIRSPISPLPQTDPDVIAGRQLFIQANCQNCHGGPLWTSGKVRHTGVPDPSLLVAAQLITELKGVGTFDSTARNEVRANALAPLGASGFVPAPLLSLFAFPATFFHNGSANSLEAVLENVTHRSAGTPGTDHLVEVAQRQRLVKFLLSIDAATPPISPASPTALSTVSAASYRGAALSQEGIVTGFGTALATGTQSATAVPLPVALAGTTVLVVDAAGTLRLAPLFYVSPTQVNYQIPPGVVPGAATVRVYTGSGQTAAGTLQVARVWPALFTANADGRGAPAALAVRARQDGSQSPVAVFQCDNQGRNCTPAPIDLGAETDQVAVSLFGTGIRNRSALSAVTCTIGGAAAQVPFAGAQGAFVGLDQVNVLVPASLRGRGEVEVLLTVDGQAANPVTIRVL